MSKEVLWISLCAPYDKVSHAGGKTHNFYLKELVKENDLHISLISFCESKELQIAADDLKKIGIRYDLIPWLHNISIKNIKRKLYLFSNEYNPYDRFGGQTNRYYLECIEEVQRKRNYKPDVIILQWTEMVLFVEKIRKMFPDSKIIAIEEDVKFLKAERRMKEASSRLQRFIFQRQYIRSKKSEISALKKVDVVIANNFKDEALLHDNGIKKVEVLSVYFDDYSDCTRHVEDINNDIVFFGAMSREDNYKSAIWFIDNVMKELDRGFCFKVVGSNPPRILKDYQSSNVDIVGFVDSIKPYFEKSLCFVAPLVSGAGVKVKVLEALSSGIPVLTNEIGIEGIAAKDGKEFYYCKLPEDYIKLIRSLKDKKALNVEMSRQAREMIKQKYDLNRDAHSLYNLIMTP